MSELAEGARLEIACTTNRGTEGSNPSLSAIEHADLSSGKPAPTSSMVGENKRQKTHNFEAAALLPAQTVYPVLKNGPNHAL